MRVHAQKRKKKKREKKTEDEGHAFETINVDFMNTEHFSYLGGFPKVTKTGQRTGPTHACLKAPRFKS